MRPTKIDYYLNIAKAVSLRGTCLRRRFGAIIVKDDQIISTGYVGAPRKTPNCIDIGKCLREELSIQPGERYELCRSVHAEANAIINAARAGVSLLGGKLYLYGENVKDNSVAVAEPCKMCKRMIINAGLKSVNIKTKEGFKEILVEDLIKEDKGLYSKDEIKGY